MKKKDLIKQLVKGSAKPTFGTNPFDPWSAKAGINENILDRFLRSKGIDPRFVSVDQKVGHAKSSDYIKWKADHQYAESVEEVDEAKIKMNFKMPPESVADRLYRKQMELRKKRGAPDPEEYKKLGAQKQKEIEDLKKEEVASSTDKLKTDYDKVKGQSSNPYKKDVKLTSMPYPKTVKKEEVESIDEISKELKTSYRQKAIGDIRALRPHAEKGEYRDLAKNVMKKRQAGVNRSMKEEDELEESHVAIAMGKILDDEGSMIMNQMDTMEKSISILRGVVKDPKMQVPAWVQAKVTLATDYIESVAGYMSTKNEDVNESFEDEHGIKEVPPKAEKEWKKVAQARSEKWRRQQVKRIDEDPLTVEEDTYHDTTAATQMNYDMGNNSYDVEVKVKNPNQVQRSKSARIIKSIYKNKNMKEDIYDHEKDDKMTQVMGKKPKIMKMDKDTVGDEPTALVVMSGGKTLTGEPRDTVEIDPLMRGRPSQQKTANKAEKK